MAQPQTPIEQFLAPLAKLTRSFPDLDGAVIWADGSGWQAQDDTLEMLDAEEIPFYAEGLLLEGFGFAWQALADAESPRRADQVLLFFWEPGVTPPALPLAEEGWVILASAEWTAPL